MTMQTLTEFKTCRLCHGSQLTRVLSLAPTPVGDLYLPAEKHPEALESFPLDVAQCETCGHVQLESIPDLGCLYTDYIYTTSSSLGLADHFARYAKNVCDKLSLAKGSLVVDMGSNDGTLLKAFKALGMKVIGIDPAREIAAKATQEGVFTYNAFFSKELAQKIRQEHGPASVFIANNVMANVPDPSFILEGIQELLPSDGVFVFETGYLRYIAEDCVFDNIYHEHIDYYSIKPLVAFFERFKMRLFDVEVTESKGSSIRCFVQGPTAAHAISPQIDALLQRETEKGYATPAPYEQLAKRLAETKRQLHELLTDMKAQGKKVAGYGAAIGTTTILYHFDLDGLIPQLIDDNPVRQGRLSPGLALPVVGSEVLEGPDAPDAVVILAWRYAEPIMKRNAAYRERGGKFIKILPTLEVC
jgi:SAM-dependent methyltransferase